MGRTSLSAWPVFSQISFIHLGAYDESRHSLDPGTDKRGRERSREKWRIEKGTERLRVGENIVKGEQKEYEFD